MRMIPVRPLLFLDEDFHRRVNSTEKSPLCPSTTNPSNTPRVNVTAFNIAVDCTKPCMGDGRQLNSHIYLELGERTIDQTLTKEEESDELEYNPFFRCHKICHPGHILLPEHINGSWRPITCVRDMPALAKQEAASRGMEDLQLLRSIRCQKVDLSGCPMAASLEEKRCCKHYTGKNMVSVLVEHFGSAIDLNDAVSSLCSIDLNDAVSRSTHNSEGNLLDDGIVRCNLLETQS